MNHRRRVLGAIVTQTSSYMMSGGLEYGYACIFVRSMMTHPLYNTSYQFQVGRWTDRIDG